MVGGKRHLPGVSFIREQWLLSWSNHLPKAPLPNTIMLGIRISTNKHSVHNRKNKKKGKGVLIEGPGIIKEVGICTTYFWDGKESQLKSSTGNIWEKWEISLTFLCGVNLWSTQLVKKQSFHPRSWSWLSFPLISTLFFMMLTTLFVKEHLPSLQWFLPSLNSYPLPMHTNRLILGAMFVQCGSILMSVDCSCRWLILARTEMPT